MTAPGPLPAGSGRTAAVLTGFVVAAIALTAWVAIAAAGRAPAEMMLRAVPATYRPAAQTAPVARALPQRMGNWTPRRGVRIARRAMRWLNTPYSFGAGGPHGPSYGVPVDFDSRNDGHVYGFDCSGLTMYALAPWLSLDHYAAAQYSEVGSFHPAIDALQPGDLVFWSADGTVQRIGHVAIYLGAGKVVQAPRSGDVIRVTPIYEVEAGTMGATRPLS